MAANRWHFAYFLRVRHPFVSQFPALLRRTTIFVGGALAAMLLISKNQKHRG
jgi:hypothetical protein